MSSANTKRPVSGDPRPAVVPLPLMIGKTLAHYQVLEKIGAGGMGEVYRARDTRLGRDVAIKVLPPIFAQDAERMARFEREAQVLASLNHPNIAALYGLEESGGFRALVMELVEGSALAGPLPIDEARAIARQIAEALEYAHDRGIVHRDLKPANVKITPDGKVKVLDFGLAKALDDDPASSSLSNSPTLSIAATRAGVILGTAAYMSPEQAKGKPADRRADIWSFGVVLYEILTGKQLYTGETAPEILASVMKDHPDFDALPASTPPAIRHLLRRCLQRDPRRRLQAIGEARIILENPEASAAEPPRLPLAPSPRRLLPWVAAAVFALALAALSISHFREKPPEAPVSRFVMPAPEKAAIFQVPVISPDGRRVAFAGTGQDGRRTLWVRSLDSLEPRSLPGTDEALFPSWSADGRFLAFSGGGKLKKIEATGGPPQALCDVQSFALGGSWNREGVIIFGSLSGGLKRVSSAGGVAAPLTDLDSSSKDSYHCFPQFLPDGRHFLYIAVSAQPENSAVYVASLESPRDRKRLLHTAYDAVYAPPQHDGPGHLLFLRDGTLLAQSFDEKRLELSGEAFPVAEQVGTYRDLAFFSVSSNGALVYRSGAGQTSQLVWFDRAGKQLQAAGPPGDYNDLALSPDDSRAAVSRRDLQSSNRDLWLIELSRNTSSRFTFHEAIDYFPVWSPDGARIAFSSPRDGPESLYQKVSSGAGSDELLLKSSGNPLWANDWSSDGRYLLYSSQDPKTRSDLWVLPMEGDRKPAPYLQTPFSESQGQFSPDGKFVAYTSNESGNAEVYVQPFPASGAKWMISSGGGAMPRWPRDGKEIFYLAGLRLMVVEVKTSPRFEVSLPQPLFETRVYGGTNSIAFRYAASSNGQRFLINTSLEETASVPIIFVQNWLRSSAQPRP